MTGALPSRYKCIRFDKARYIKESLTIASALHTNGPYALHDGLNYNNNGIG